MTHVSEKINKIRHTKNKLYFNYFLSFVLLHTKKYEKIAIPKIMGISLTGFGQNLEFTWRLGLIIQMGLKCPLARKNPDISFDVVTSHQQI